MHRCLIALTLASLLGASPTLASTGYHIGFGPFVGGGSISTGGSVRHTSGYAASLERRWQLTPRLSLGPRLEVSNAFVNAREDDDGARTISTYDNRLVAGGLTLAHAVGNDGTLAQAVYLAAVAGRGYSKLTVDESSERSYQQRLYGKISGDYFGGELGVWLPLRGDFGVSLAFATSLYRADQTASPHSFDGDTVDEQGNLTLVSGSAQAADGSLPATAVIRTGAVKVGLSFGF